MADEWNQAAEAQEITDTVQRLVNVGKKCDLAVFDNFTQFQTENVNEVSLGNEVKPPGEEGEEPK